MDSEIKIIIAFLFNRSGKKEMSFSEIYLSLSMDLNWFTPDDAKKFLNYAINNKFLIKKGSLIEPAIEINKITIPVGFTPTKKIQFKDESKDIVKSEEALIEIVNRIAEKTDLTNEEINEKIKVMSTEKTLTEEVSALLFAKGYDINFEDLFDEIENKIFINQE